VVQPPEETGGCAPPLRVRTATSMAPRDPEQDGSPLQLCSSISVTPPEVDVGGSPLRLCSSLLLAVATAAAGTLVVAVTPPPATAPSRAAAAATVARADATLGASEDSGAADAPASNTKRFEAPAPAVWHSRSLCAASLRAVARAAAASSGALRASDRCVKCSGQSTSPGRERSTPATARETGY